MAVCRESTKFNSTRMFQPLFTLGRTVPVPKKEAMRKELDKMVAEKIIAPVTEPTDWVSSVLAILKKDGSVRIFLDPRDLNKF